jgi:hypothetical protein
MSTLIHWQPEARDFKYIHASNESDRSRKTRKPIYSRLTSRGGASNDFQRRRIKPSF